MLCKISYWDGTETDLWYISGQLRSIQNPGNDTTLYAYESHGLLGYVANDAEPNDWVAQDPANRNTIAIYTEIDYTSNGGVSQPTKVISPAPATRTRPGQSTTTGSIRRTSRHSWTR